MDLALQCILYAPTAIATAVSQDCFSWPMLETMSKFKIQIISVSCHLHGIEEQRIPTIIARFPATAAYRCYWTVETMNFLVSRVSSTFFFFLFSRYRLRLAQH